MATVFKSAVLPVPASVAWPRVAAVDRVHDIIPAITACQLDGDKRYCRFANGAELKERILSIDPERMRVAYTVAESPFGFEFHAAAMQVVPEGAGCRFVWTSDIKPDRLEDELAPLYAELFDQLVSRLSAG